MSTTWKDAVKAAHEMIHALCQPRASEGSRQWIMSIPAREDYDPDLVITSGLMAAEKQISTLAAEVDELREENIRLDRKRFENVHAARRFLSKLRSARAEVDARDEVITKLLDLTAPHVDDFGNRQWWQYKRPEQMHARACEIAGRME